MEIKINDIKYKVLKDEGNTISDELLQEMVTDYFKEYDYIVGDWAYGKLRLKGFNDKTNKYYKPINDYKNVDDYIAKSCAYGCKYFIIQKLIEKQD